MKTGKKGKRQIVKSYDNEGKISLGLGLDDEKSLN